MVQYHEHMCYNERSNCQSVVDQFRVLHYKAFRFASVPTMDKSSFPGKRLDAVARCFITFGKREISLPSSREGLGVPY